MNPVITFAKGSEYFGIKPYKVCITGYERSKAGEVLEFIVYDVFTKLPDGKFKVELTSRYGFNPNDVVISNELKQELENDHVVLPAYAFTSREKPVILRRRVGSMESECPGFQKYWEQEEEECKACAKCFPDEYSMCKKICLEKKEARATPALSTNETVKPVAQPVQQEFKGFREGTRADVLIKYLESRKSCTLQEASQHLAKTMSINDRVAMANVKGYAYEWSKGKWNNIVQNFPFVVVIQGEVIQYSTR